MEDYHIALLTRGRIGKQKTLQMLHPITRKLINVYCHSGELKEHKKNWKGLVNSIQEYGKECKNQSEARDYIIKKCKSKYVIFLDDNLRFQTRLPSKNKLSGSCNELVSKNYNDETILKEQTNIFFFLISNLRKGYGMTGISFRPFNRIKKEDFEENSKIFAIWGLNVPLYKKISIRLSDFELKEDYAINLALLQSGYKNIVSFYYAFDKTSGANSEGGCLTFRTIKKSDESALKLKETFPDFVRLNKKSTKNWGGEFKEQMEMLEVVVYWKKTYKIKG